MAIDTDRLIQVANELKSLEQHRANLLDELERIASGLGGRVPFAPRRGRPPGSTNRPSARKSAAVRRGRPPGSKNRAKTAAPVNRPKRRKGLTADLVGLLADGGSYTAGEIVSKLKLPKTPSQISSVSTTLVRLVKEGRAKKDKERGYRAALSSERRNHLAK